MTRVARSRDELSDSRADLGERSGGGKVAVVMTMGALHAGHTELIQQAKRRANTVIVTDFLNPLQFAPGEDLDKYPQTMDADLALCRGEGVDLLFAPTPEVVYPAGEPLVRISAGPVGDILEGRSRSGHFDGVLTVVAKLLHLTCPDLAYFGQKDAQQLWLIDRMVRDLDLPVEIVAVPTVRAADGVALSSRNTYLGEDDRVAARSLHRALRAGLSVAASGPSAVLQAASTVLLDEPAIRVDYLELVDPQTFAPVASHHDGDCLLLVAAFVGKTRLIDNVALSLSAAGKAS